MTKKLVIISVLSIAVLLVAFAFFIYFDQERNDLLIGQWDMDYSVEEGSEIIINFIGLEERKIFKKSTLSKIIHIKLKGTSDISISDFNIKKGDRVSSSHVLFNIVLSLRNQKINENKDFNQIEILYSNGSSESFDIGHIRVRSNEKLVKNMIQPFREYTVAYPNNKFEATLINHSNRPLTLNQVQISNSTASLKNIRINGEPFNTEIEILSNENFKIEFDLKFDKKIPFYMIVPRLYLREGEIMEIVELDKVMYGIMDINNETMAKMLDTR